MRIAPSLRGAGDRAAPRTHRPRHDQGARSLMALAAAAVRPHAAAGRGESGLYFATEDGEFDLDWAADDTAARHPCADAASASSWKLCHDPARPRRSNLARRAQLALLVALCVGRHAGRRPACRLGCRRRHGRSHPTVIGPYPTVLLRCRGDRRQARRINSLSYSRQRLVRSGCDADRRCPTSAPCRRRKVRLRRCWRRRRTACRPRRCSG